MEERAVSEESAGFRVAGMVQGVGFRQWTCRAGTDLGLRGAVRNLADGSVEVHVAGPVYAIARLELRLADGPPSARVDRVERAPSSMPLPSRGFNIER